MIEYIENSFCHSGLFETECPIPGEENSVDKLARNVYLRSPTLDCLRFSYNEYFDYANFIVEIKGEDIVKYDESSRELINLVWVYRVNENDLVDFVLKNRQALYAGDCVRVSIEGYDRFGRIVDFLEENFPKIAEVVEARNFYIEFVLDDDCGWFDGPGDYASEIHRIINPLTANVGFRVNDFTSL